MSSNEPRLRGSARRRRGPYPLGQLPDAVMQMLGKQLVHRIAVGQGDINGDDFGTIFANAIGGIHRNSPLGIADVVLDRCAWSVKTIKRPQPFTATTVRLISGRNSPNYSLGISDPHDDTEQTGRAVLEVWNARVDEALAEHNELRIVVMVRNLESREFLVFEEEAVRFTPEDFTWEYNSRGNLEGCNRVDGTHHFTWQPHGSQFTIFRVVPASAQRFSVNRDVPLVSFEEVLSAVNFENDWISIHRREQREEIETPLAPSLFDLLR